MLCVRFIKYEFQPTPMWKNMVNLKGEDILFNKNLRLVKFILLK